jgi:hypothetical protein
LALTENTRPVAATAVAVDDDRSYVDWAAIIAGAVLATAISLVLLTFGSAIGLSMASLEPGSGVSLFWMAIVAALWLLWVQISSFLAGGYITGRLRKRHGDSTEHESDIRDGSHGLIVWALGLLLGAAIAFSGATGVLSSVGAAAGAIGSGVATVSDDIAGEFGADSLLVDRTLRAGPRATQPVPEGVRGEVGRILLSAAAEGQLDDADREYLVSVISARAGIPQEEAEQRIDQIVTRAGEIQAEAVEAAETARRVGMVAAFIAAASLLVSAVAAYFGATLGGKHRDQNTVFADWSRPW